MKRLILLAIFLAFLAGPAYADLYQWSDESGRVHITDSMEKVPAKYRGSVSVFQEGAKESPAPEETAPVEDVQSDDSAVAPDDAVGQTEELYGDETLEWWTQSFQEKRTAISNLENSIDMKTRFIEVFEAGRRFGQVFDSESVAKYKAFKQELPAELKELSALKEEYEDFQEKAGRAGVPREIREQ